MADFNMMEDESAAAESPTAQKETKAGGKKKKKRGCGFFLLLAVLAAGVAYGFQASGALDLRPYVYPVIPKIPYVGETLKDLLAIPDIYAVTAEERRRIEIEEWELGLAEERRSLDELVIALDERESELDERETALDADREELAERLLAISEEAALNEADGLLPGRTPGGDEIEETIRTFQDMSPRNAAAILAVLDENLAVAILDGLSLDSRGSLLGRMDAEKAARLTEQLSDLQRRRSRQ